MGYFSSGTEGLDYQAALCVRCVHHDAPTGCEVWMLHMLHNYEECTKPDSFLHVLIPRTKAGLTNGKCRMFAAKAAR